MSSKSTFSLREIADLVKQDEGPALEFKRTSGELREGMQTLCAFLNGSGGTVLFGIFWRVLMGNIDGRTRRPMASPFRISIGMRSFVFSKPPV